MAAYWYFDDEDNIYDSEDPATRFFGGSEDDDVMYGYGGDDVLEGKSGNDTLYGGVGNDNLFGGESGNDSLYGDAGDDWLDGGSGNNMLDGGAGNDALIGSGSSDILKGGVGNDTYLITGASQTVVELAGGGTDTVQSLIDYTLTANVENLLLCEEATKGTGNILNNALQGNNEDNVLYGLAGNDTLDGGEGNDALVGGAGNDSYYVDSQGEGGVSPFSGDAYWYGALGDLVSEFDIVLTSQGYYDWKDAGGIDTVYSSVDYDLYEVSYVENLTLTGTAQWALGSWGNNTLTGNGMNNILVGDSGNDTLRGQDGNDILAGGFFDFIDEWAWGNSLEQDNLFGGSGDDTYHVTSSNTKVSEATVIGGNIDEGGDDTVISYLEKYVLPNYVENLTIASSYYFYSFAYGNILDNTLTGNDDYNTLDGGKGADLMIGGEGDDIYYVDDAGDTIVEVDEFDYDYVYSSVNGYTLPENVECLYLTGSAVTGNGNDLSNDLYGNLLNNTLYGGVGYDYLDGGLGNDTMFGGANGDTYVVNSVGDKVYESTTADSGDDLGGWDTVRSSITYTLGELIEGLNLTGAAAITGIGNGSGNDIGGNAGANKLYGLAGNDWLYGGNGADFLYGGEDDDWLDGGDGIDTLYGDDGDDSLDGGTGNDKMYGGAGSDDYEIDSAGDVVVETYEDHLGDRGDRVSSSNVSIVLSDFIEEAELRGANDLNATGNNGDNFIFGNDGDNILKGSKDIDFGKGTGGEDFLKGGAGNDTYYVDSNGDMPQEYTEQLDEFGNIVTDGEGNPIFVDPGGNDTVIAMLTSFELDDYKTSDGHSVLENLTLLGNQQSFGYGNELDNVLTGNGWSYLEGGGGNDIYITKAIAADKYDEVVEAAEGGVDTVKTYMSGHELEDNCENLILLGTTAKGYGNASDNLLVGNASNNILYGLDGADVLNGGAGADIMYGGAGDDSYWVDNIGDKADETLGGSSGVDVVYSTVSFTLGTDVENLILTGTSVANGTGNALENNIHGNGAANILDGREGTDYLYGGRGNDTLKGGEGNDELHGGLGNDILTGDAGADTYVFETALDAATNKDTITLFSVEDDAIQLDQSVFGTLSVGGLDAGDFWSGASIANPGAIDAYIVYNTTTGALYFNEDRAGGTAAIQFATLTGSPDELSAAQFTVVA